MTAWMKLQQGVKGAVSWGTPIPQAAFSVHQDVFSAMTCNVFCAGGWSGQKRHLESICVAIVRVINPPFLNSSGLQVFSKDKPSPDLSFIAGCLLSKCLK